MEGYKRYIKGVYYHDSKLRETLGKEGRESTFEALRKGYPRGWKYQKLAKTYELANSSAYQACIALDNADIIKGEGKKPRYYYFEDYNYVNNKKELFRFPFAPGYVQYDEDFLINFKRLNEKFEFQIHQIYSSLTDILMEAVRIEKQTSTRQQCKNCGYDHEMRDFIRATLLHLIDELEESDKFIDFMHKEEIINKTVYEQLKSELQCTTLKVKEHKATSQKELFKEQQSTQPIENEEPTARHTTLHKQYKRGPHTEEWKRQNSLRMKRRWNSKNEHEKQKFIESVREYPIKDHAFDMPLSADAKYWIGYTMGCASIGNDTRIRFEKSKQDRNHLERFKEFIDSDRPVRDIKDTNRCALEFSSPIIRDKLKEYGIHNNMKHNQKVSILEDNRDFWRGVIDGNGRFKSPSKKDNTSIKIKRGRDLILQFKTFAEKILGRTIGRPEEEVKNWSLTLTDKDALELYRKLLCDKDSIALDRNLKWMNQVSSLSKYKTKI